VDPKRRLFAKEYLVDLDAPKAAERAGFAPSAGTKLLKEPLVARAVERGLLRREAAIERTAERVMEEVGAIAFSDLRKAFRDDGSLLPPHLWPDELAPALSSVKVNELFEFQDRADGGRGREKVQVGFTKEIKLWDKPAALGMLGKYFKLWADQIEVKVETMSDEERILRAEALITAGLARARERALLAAPREPFTVDAEPSDGEP
jgi:phage terminase small subunit